MSGTKNGTGKGLVSFLNMSGTKNKTSKCLRVSFSKKKL